MRYQTKNGDMLDQICLAYYGTTSAVEKVLKANRELAQQSAKLPAGIVIELPDFDLPTQEDNPVRLWE